MVEKKEAAGVGVLIAVGVGLYLLTRKPVEAAPTPPEVPPTEPPGPTWDDGVPPGVIIEIKPGMYKGGWRYRKVPYKNCGCDRANTKYFDIPVHPSLRHNIFIAPVQAKEAGTQFIPPDPQCINWEPDPAWARYHRPPWTSAELAKAPMICTGGWWTDFGTPFIEKGGTYRAPDGKQWTLPIPAQPPAGLVFPKDVTVTLKPTRGWWVAAKGQDRLAIEWIQIASALFGRKTVASFPIAPGGYAYPDGTPYANYRFDGYYYEPHQPMRELEQLCPYCCFGTSGMYAVSSVEGHKGECHPAILPHQVPSYIGAPAAAEARIQAAAATAAARAARAFIPRS